MNDILFYFLSSVNANEEANSESSTEKLTESLKNMVKSPIFYIVIGGLLLLIIIIYIIRRFVSSNANMVLVITRKGQIHKLLNDKDGKYFLVPFIDKVGATISTKEQELNSDKLFINNGPDALYKINYTLKYQIDDVEAFYPYRDNIQNLIVNKLNDDLREYADKGSALILVKDYREHAKEILDIINKAIEEYHVAATSFKINLIEPVGR